MSEAFRTTVLEPLLGGALLPLAVAFGLVLLGRIAPQRWRRPEALAGLGLAAGAVVGQASVLGLPTWPPREALHWLPLAALAAWLVGLASGTRGLGHSRWLGQAGPAGRAGRTARLGARSRMLRALAPVLQALLCGALGAALARPLMGRVSEAGLSLALFGLALLGPFLIAWLGAARRQALPFALVPLLVAAGSLAGVLLLSGSARVGRVAGALCAALAGLALAALCGWLKELSTSALVVAVTLWLGLGTVAAAYTETSPVALALLTLALGAAGLARLPLIGLLSLPRRLLLGALVALLPAALALLLAWSRFEPDPYGSIASARARERSFACSSARALQLLARLDGARRPGPHRGGARGEEVDFAGRRDRT